MRILRVKKIKYVTWSFVCAMMSLLLFGVSAGAKTSVIDQGTSGTCTWVLDGEGTLTISPTDGESGTLGEMYIQESRYDESGIYSIPWSSQKENIKSVFFEKGIHAGNTLSKIFSGCSNLITVDFSDFNTEGVTCMDSMFEGCSKLESIDLSMINMESAIDYASGDASLNVENLFSECNSLKRIVTPKKMMKCKWHYINLPKKFKDNEGNIYSDLDFTTPTHTVLSVYSELDTEFTVKYKDAETAYGTSGTCKWEIDDEGTLVIEPIDGKYGVLENRMDYKSDEEWGGREQNICKVVFKSGVHSGKSLRYMFDWCTNLTEIDFGDFDTSNAIDVSSMFGGCSKLKYIDLRQLDLRNVASADAMMAGSGIESIELWDVFSDNLVDVSYMFSSCDGLTDLSLGSLDTSNVENMSGLFFGCDNLKKIDLTGWDTGKVTNMRYMFYNCSSLSDLNLRGFDTGNVEDMSYMFSECHSLSDINLRAFDTKNVKDMRDMFSECYNLSNVNLQGIDTKNVTDMASMFLNCSGLKNIDVSNFNTSKVTSFGAMFAGCSGLTSLDVSNFNTGKAVILNGMFARCNGLASLDVSNFDTSNVVLIDGMFYNCSRLETLDLSGFELQKIQRYDIVSNNDTLLYGCTSLKTIITPKAMMSDKWYVITLPGAFKDKNGGTYKELDYSTPTNMVLNLVLKTANETNNKEGQKTTSSDLSGKDENKQSSVSAKSEGNVRKPAKGRIIFRQKVKPPANIFLENSAPVPQTIVSC